ncbi:MAG: carbamoyltransferase [Microthrixaceae bacterium]
MSHPGVSHRLGGRRGRVLGLSVDFHASAAALVDEGVRVAAAKHDPSPPVGVIRWLAESGALDGGLDLVAVHSKPLAVLDRVMWSHGLAGLRGLAHVGPTLSRWGRSKLWIEYRIEQLLTPYGLGRTPVVFVEHHESHAASAFFPSPFDEAAVLTFDGVGEWTTGSVGTGRGSRVELLREQRYPDSIGLFYSAMTAFCGFEVNDGEYKLMGLAPYGVPQFADVIRERMVHIFDDGSVRLNLKWFRFLAGGEMTSPRAASILGGPPRRPGGELGQREADLAASTQAVLEDVVLRSARFAAATTGHRQAVLSGGVALNCVANRRLVEEGPFDEIWVQPAAGDAGGCVGAAFWASHHVLDQPRSVFPTDGMRGALLGPEFTDQEVQTWLESNEVHATVLDPGDVADVAAARLADGAVMGWFQGRMEFGPRALGNRSILADPRLPDMVQRINTMVKGREGFRPFAPAVLEQESSAWFELDRPAPYMLVTAGVRGAEPTAPFAGDFAERLGQTRSAIPACTHVDLSARVQTVATDRAPLFHELLTAFYRRSGVPVLLNTSFNRRDEPIVRSPFDAVMTAGACGLDLLVIGRFVVERDELQRWSTALHGVAA